MGWSDNFKDINMMVGRFQPLTNGHMHCIEQLYENTGIKTVLMLIKVPESDTDNLHPFPSKILYGAYLSLMFEYDCIEDILFVDNANILTNTTLLKEYGYKPVSWICGDDRYDAYKQMAERYSGQFWASKDFKVICIPRNEYNISATQVREFIRNNDYEAFKHNTPFQMLSPRNCEIFFGKLQKALLKHDNL